MGVLKSLSLMEFAIFVPSFTSKQTNILREIFQLLIWTRMNKLNLVSKKIWYRQRKPKTMGNLINVLYRWNL